MEVKDTKLEGVKIITPKKFFDERGYFMESWNQYEFNQKVAKINFLQQNQSYSVKTVFRGFHFQAPPYAQAKLVSCLVGEVVDIAVDLRESSASFGEYIAVKLTGKNCDKLFIPKGFAHGFYVTSEHAILQYMCDEVYHPESEGCLHYTEVPVLPKELENQLIISNKDLCGELLSNIRGIFK